MASRAQNSPDLNLRDYSVWKILQEKVYKTGITDEMIQRLRTVWDNMDHVVIVAAIRQWRRRYVQINDACFVHDDDHVQ